MNKQVLGGLCALLTWWCVTPALARPSPQPAASAKASIGSATMQADGTIVLILRAEDGKGAVGDGRIEYKKTHPDYGKILDHLGGLKPGQSKPVPPWAPPRKD